MSHDQTTHSFTAVNRTFWIAHGPALHFGVLAPGESLSSGQASFETFPRRLPWRTRVIELGGNPDAASSG
ncbi:hypothetical protein EOM89_11435 [Candidatus Falkowbacteria bacterium]|nr:hypothetical protein [Candidatus Falkowbacteria bacterium]